MASLHDVARAAGVRVEDAREVFDQLLTMVREGQRVTIHGFGAFFTKKRKASVIYSPQIPGGKAVLPERTVLRFKASDMTRAKTPTRPKTVKVRKVADDG